MPTQHLLSKKKSREQLTEKFLTHFNCSYLPGRAEFISFLKQHELSCFVKEKAVMKLRIVQDAAANNHKLVFCLPVSICLSYDFIRKLSELLRRTNRPVVLYWAWELPDNKGYVPLYISIEREDEVVHFQTDILNADESHFLVAPVLQLLNTLKAQLNEFRFILAESRDCDAPIIGDDPYWTALHLFLKLAQKDAVSYCDDFKKWQVKNKSKLQFATEHLLNFIPCVHPTLFSFEKYMAIVKMDLLRFNIIYSRIPTWIKNIPLESMLRVAALGHVFYEVYKKENYFSLGYFPLMFGLHYLTTSVMKKSSEGYTGLVLYYLCQLFSVAFQLAFNLYSVIPGNFIQRDIIAPRYIFYWITAMIKEMIKFPVNFAGMAIFLGFISLAGKLFHQKTINMPNNQAGFRAIAFIVMQFFIASIEKYLFQFSRWVFPQHAEEHILSLMNGFCNEPCRFDIKSGLATRVLQQAFSDTQSVSIEAKTVDVTTKCDIKISLDHGASPCANYQLDCQSRFFEGYANNVTSALTKEPTTQVYPTQKMTFC